MQARQSATVLCRAICRAEMALVPDTVRDMAFGKYVVRYSVHTSTLIILRVWHALEDER